MLTPAIRALIQLDDRVFLGVVLHSVVWSALAFLVLAAGVVGGAHAGSAALGPAGLPGWWVGLPAGLGGVGAALLALVLFVPVAAGIASLFIDRVADAVERRWYPGLPPARPAPLASQVWDGIALGVRVLLMQLVALVLALLLPGVGLALGWLVTAWAIGRGLFVPVAMRRMDRAAATSCYRRARGPVLVQGGLLAAAGLVPLVNLLVPVLGVAAMVHVLHAERAGVQQRAFVPGP